MNSLLIVVESNPSKRSGEHYGTAKTSANYPMTTNSGDRINLSQWSSELEPNSTNQFEQKSDFDCEQKKRESYVTDTERTQGLSVHPDRSFLVFSLKPFSKHSK